MMRARAAALGLCLLLAGSAVAGEPDVVEEIVAIVRGPGAPQPRVVTRTRLEEEARVALVFRGATAAATAPLDRAALRAALDWLVDQTLLGDEVARLQIIEVEAAAVEEALARFRARFAAPADYRAFVERLELPEEELAAILRRTLRTERYVESRAGADPAAAEKKVRALLADLRARSEIRILGELGVER